MRKFLFLLSLLCGLLANFSQVKADSGQDKTIRFFLNTGELLDFDATLIDSITTTAGQQTIWFSDTCRSIAVEEIDSIWYMTPALKLTTKSLNFGKVAVGNRKMLTATITNMSEFPETYFMLADGVFSATNSGKDFLIAAGESQSVELYFEPTALSSGTDTAQTSGY